MEPARHTPIPLKDRVPFGQKVAYGLGGLVEGTAVWIPKSNILPIFNIGMGISPAWIGIITMLWRAWDAFADPLMGNVSDNARTPWGRRRPFIVAGAILTGLTLPLIWWMPRGLGQWQSAAWLLIAGLIFYTCYTIWAMPYYSLQLELTPDYDERTNVTAYRAFTQKVVAMAAGWVLAFASLPLFNTNGKPDLVNGMRYLSVGLAILTILFGVLPGLFVKERYYNAESGKQARQNLFNDVRLTLGNRQFVWILLIVFTNTFGFGLVASLGFYINAYCLCNGDIARAAEIQGLKTTLLFAPGLLVIPLCTWLASRYDKRALIYLTGIAGIIGLLSVYLFYTPANPWLQLIPAVIIGPINVGLWLVVPSMQADVADFDELQHGQRREGSFASIFSWVFKLSMTVNSGFGGLVLVWTGFDIKNGAHQPAHVLNNLKLFYIWIPIGFLLLGFFAISRYNLTRERMQAIRMELEARRGAI